MESLAWVDVAHEHCGVDSHTDARCVIEELDAGFAGIVAFYEDKVYVDEVEYCGHC